MPYIKQNLRKIFNPFISGLVLSLRAVPHDKLDGCVNYIITKLLLKVYREEENYYNYNRAMGVLSCVEKEIYRRWIAVYEDLKRDLEGDLE